MTETTANAEANGSEPAIVLPHRGKAVVLFALAAVACLGLAALAWLALEAELVLAEEPEGELVVVLGGVLVAACGVAVVAAWQMGAGDLERMKAGTMDPAGKLATRCGLWLTKLLVLSVIGLGLTVLVRHLIDLWQVYVLH